MRSEKDYFQHWKANAEDSLKHKDEQILSQATQLTKLREELMNTKAKQVEFDQTTSQYHKKTENLTSKLENLEHSLKSQSEQKDSFQSKYREQMELNLKLKMKINFQQRAIDKIEEGFMIIQRELNLKKDILKDYEAKIKDIYKDKEVLMKEKERIESESMQFNEQRKIFLEQLELTK